MISELSIRTDRSKNGSAAVYRYMRRGVFIMHVSTGKVSHRY